MTPRPWLCILIALCCVRTASCETQQDDDPQPVLQFTLRYAIEPERGCTRLRFVTLLPADRPRRQKVLSISYSHKPKHVRDVAGSRYAQFDFENPGKPFDLTIRCRVRLSRYDWTLARQNPPDMVKEERPSRWLTAEKFIESSEDRLEEIAASLKGASDAATVRAVHGFVLERLRYLRYNPADVGALGALKARGGDCTEYSDLTVALCRAAGVPARVVEGLIYPYHNVPRHVWVEVHLDRLGWVPLDPTLADGKKATVDELRPIYVYLSNTRNDKMLNGYHYWAYRWWGAKVSVTDSITFQKPEKAE